MHINFNDGYIVIINQINMGLSVSDVSTGHRMPLLSTFITLNQDEQSGKTEEMKFLAAPKSTRAKKQMDLSVAVEIVLQ